MNQELHFEHGDLTGEISLSLNPGVSLDDIFAKYIHEYNRERFEAIAIRMFAGKETVVTMYALDKSKKDNSQLASDKIPVKKFKIVDFPLNELWPLISSLNCTLNTNNYPIEAMEVINR